MTRSNALDITAAPDTPDEVAISAPRTERRRRSTRRLLVFDPVADDALLDTLWSTPDSLISNGQLLKNGDRCTVACAQVGQTDVVVKRYNLRDPLHTARHWLLRSRARWSWLNGRRLRDGGLCSPRPLAYVEQRLGPCRGRSFLVTAHQNGPTLFDLIKYESVPAERLASLASRFKSVWDGLGVLRFGHGDMKATNFIVDDHDQLWLVDLDAMRHYPPGPSFNHRRERDLNRFMQNWTSFPHAAEAFRDALDTDAAPDG